MTRYLGLSAVTELTDDEAYPGCGTTAGVQPQPLPPKVVAWTCTECGLEWAVTVVNAHLRAGDQAAARWVLRQIVQLAEQADGLTDQQLRHRLVTQAESCAR